MSKEISIKIFLWVLLVVVAVVGIDSMEENFKGVSLDKVFAEYSGNERTENAANYVYGETSAISLNEVKNKKNAFIHLKFRFRADSVSGYPNLFQTAPANRGMRMEISGAVASILIPDIALPNGLKGLTLTTALKAGQWYVLDVEAVNNDFVRASLDGRLVADYASSGLEMDMSQILIGCGFDASRPFVGEIEGISAEIGNKPLSLKIIFSVISNTAIIATALVIIFLIAAVKFCFNKNIDIFFEKFKFFGAIFYVLTIVQAVLILLLPAYRDVVVAYLFLFFIGLTLYIGFNPDILKDKFNYFLYAPINGLLIISLMGSYFIGFSVSMNLLVPALVFLSIVNYAVIYRIKKLELTSIFAEIKSNFTTIIVIYSVIISPLIIFLILPTLLAGYQTSPFRVGPDLATYAKMSQYLIDGGTWSQAVHRAPEFSGMSTGEINRYSNATMSWPFMFYFRWGLTAFQIVVTKITFSKQSLETAFISMALPYFLMCGMIFIWLKRNSKLNWILSCLGAVAFAFNSNIINIWYEGFYGNLYALGLMVPILYIFYQLKNEHEFSVRELLKVTAFLSMIFSAIIFGYAEAAFFVLAPFFAALMLVDFFVAKNFRWLPYIIVIVSACIGLVIVLPCGFIFEWAILIFKQITQEGGNGYPQPFWAFPHEIIGIDNIYRNLSVGSGARIFHRTALSLAVACMESIAVLIPVLFYLKKQKNDRDLIYLISIIFVVISVCLGLYKSAANNYTYMKMYVFQLPLLFLFFLISLKEFCDAYLKTNLKIGAEWLFILVALLISLNGIVYIVQYCDNDTYIQKNTIDLHNELKGIDFSNVVMLPLVGQGGIYDFMYPSVLDVRWMMPEFWNSDSWGKKPYYRNLMNYKVYVLIERDVNHPCSVNNKSVFENKYYIIIDSGKTVADGVDAIDDKIDFNKYTEAVKNVPLCATPAAPGLAG